MPRYTSQGSYYSGGDRIGDLLNQRAKMAGQVQDDPWARNLPAIIGQVGQTVGGIFQAREEYKAKEQEEAKKRAQSMAFESAIQSGDPRQILLTLGPDAGAKVLTALKANTPDGIKEYRDRMEVLRDTARGIEAAPEGSRAGLWQQAIQNLTKLRAVLPEEAEKFADYNPGLSQSLAKWGEQPKEAKAPESFTLGEGQVRYGPGGEVLAKGPEKAITPKEPKEERLVQILGPEGRPVWVRESQAVGKPTGEAGKGRELKPILSGDIEDLAGMQESIDLADSLGESLKGGKAGGASRLGAALPDVITEMTGLGAESKGTQAKINVAKQIIGKGLEGGVLRKEDEAKYEKMLPKLGDSDTVVTEKLANLKKAIENKMNRRLEALEDAGRDVTAYRRRQGGTKISGGTDTEPPDA